MKRLPIWVMTLISLLSVSAVLAQDSCSALVTQALRALDNNCVDLTRNSACYGYNQVSASFSEPVAEDFFAKPSDMASLAMVETIQTTPLDEATQTWGVALMNVQANIPNSLPGQSVVFMLIGDAELENAVSPEEIFTPATPVTLTVAVTANVRSGAGTTFNTLGRVEAGIVLKADALSADKGWLRVAFGGGVGWISRTVIQDSPSYDALPVFDGTQKTPMQAFYLRTGIGTTDCENAPTDTLLVQGPKNIKIDLTVNGANIRVGSSIAIRTPSADKMEITVIDGEVVALGGGENGEDVVIPEGTKSTVCLDDPASRGIDGNANDRVTSCAWSEPEPIEQETLNADWCALRDMSDVMWNYRIETIKCPNDPAPTPSSVQNGSNTAGSNGGGSAVPTRNCANFARLSPGDTVAFESATFSWTPFEGALNYNVSIGDRDGNYLTSYNLSASNTTLNIAPSQLPTNVFTWIVRALGEGDVVLCASSQSAPIVRLEPPPVVVVPTDVPSAPVVVPPVVFTTWLTCDGSLVKVNWSGLSEYGAGVDVYVYGSFSHTINTESGSYLSTFNSATLFWSNSDYTDSGSYPFFTC